MEELTRENMQAGVEAEMLQHCGPIFWTRNTEVTPLNILSSGTFGLINTGSKKLLVTCFHVLEGFRIDKREYPEAQLAVLLNLNEPVLLNPQLLIDSNEEIDLAVFDVGSLLSFFTRRSFYQIQGNRGDLSAGDIVSFLGYTGQGRVLSDQGANFRYDAFGLHVSDVSRFKAVVDIANSRRFVDGNETEIPSSDAFGGMSGGPAYRCEVGGELKMVGFVTSSAMGVIQISSIDCITTEGTLLH